jgi:TIR domain
MPSSVFLSHNSNDKLFVRRLAEDLRYAGVTVWVDEAEIKLGDSLLAKVEDGIKGSDYLAVILSPHSIDSSWVQRELRIALTKEIESRNVVVLPLLHCDCEMPAFLSDKLYADFRQENRYGDALNLLLDRLGAKPVGSTSNIVWPKRHVKFGKDSYDCYLDTSLNDEKFQAICLQAKGLWHLRTSEYVERHGDMGSCVLGAGFSVWHLPARSQKPRRTNILMSPTRSQGSLTWENSKDEIARFFRDNAIDVHYEWGSMD